MNSADDYIQSGNEHYYANRLRDAIADYTYAIDLSPDNPLIPNGRVRISNWAIINKPSPI